MPHYIFLRALREPQTPSVVLEEYLERFQRAFPDSQLQHYPGVVGFPTVSSRNNWSSDFEMPEASRRSADYGNMKTSES